MIERKLYKNLLSHLETYPAVALLGCRQVGKTTLAQSVSAQFAKPSIYLDLQLPEDRAQLSEPQIFLEANIGKLLILDEIHLVPELFAIMRGIIDRRRRQGEESGQYLILGSASPDLLKQSSETLAGRIGYLELGPFNIEEVATAGISGYLERLWLRGGFPRSFLSKNDEKSIEWRDDFIRTYLERDIPQLGPKLPAEKMHNLLRMLSYDQGSILNTSRLALALGMSANSVKHYLETLADLFIIRLLRPFSGNSKKRLIKAPKVYVRDSGLVHALSKLASPTLLAGHSLNGLSWEGFAIEQILSVVPRGTEACYYRSNAGAEIDLVLEIPGTGRIAIEIKRTISPKISKGFYLGCNDIGAKQRFYVILRGGPYWLDKDTLAIGLEEFLQKIVKDNDT